MKAYKFIFVIALPICGWAFELNDPEGLFSSPGGNSLDFAKSNHRAKEALGVTNEPQLSQEEDKASAVEADSPEPAAEKPSSQEDNNATGLREEIEEEPATAPETASEEEEKEESLKESIGGDAGGLGIQRLVEVKDSAITVSANYNTRYYYSSNPNARKNVVVQDITKWENGLSVNVGLGQLGVLDRLVTPSLMFMHMRIWNDPGKHHGKSMSVGDVDVQSANLSFNVELDEGWSVSLGYGESRILDYQNDTVAMTTRTPTISLSKMVPIGDADMLMIMLGSSYNLVEGVAAIPPDSLKNILPSTPTDGGNTVATNLNLTYMMPWEGIDKLTLSPSFGAAHSYYTNKTGTVGPNLLPSEGRQDVVLSYGLNATYQLTETISVQGFGMFSKKLLNNYANNPNYLALVDDEYKNFDAGIAISASYNF